MGHTDAGNGSRWDGTNFVRLSTCPKNWRSDDFRDSPGHAIGGCSERPRGVPKPVLGPPPPSISTLIASDPAICYDRLQQIPLVGPTCVPTPTIGRSITTRDSASGRKTVRSSGPLGWQPVVERRGTGGHEVRVVVFRRNESDRCKSPSRLSAGGALPSAEATTTDNGPLTILMFVSNNKGEPRHTRARSYAERRRCNRDPPRLAHSGTHRQNQCAGVLRAEVHGIPGGT